MQRNLVKVLNLSDINSLKVNFNQFFIIRPIRYILLSEILPMGRKINTKNTVKHLYSLSDKNGGFTQP